jgi:hypothetical protein
MPRGNLELIYPRLVILKLGKLIQILSKLHLDEILIVFKI